MDSIKKWFKGRSGLLAITLLLLLLLAGFHFGHFASLSSLLQQDVLRHSNIDYLTQLEGQLGKELGYLLTLQTLVDVAASSQIGISFILDINVEVGRLLSQLSDVLEKGNEAVLMSIAAVGVLQAILALSEYLSPWFLGEFLVCLTVWCGLAWFDRSVLNNELSHKLLRCLFSLFLMSHMIIPYSIHFSAALSQTVDSYFSDKVSYQYFSHMSNELVGTNKKGDLKDHAKSSIQFLHKASATKLHQKAQHGSYVVMQFVAKMLLTLVVIPFSILLGLYVLFCRLIPFHHSCIRGVAEIAKR